MAKNTSILFIARNAPLRIEGFRVYSIARNVALAIKLQAENILAKYPTKAQTH